MGDPAPGTAFLAVEGTGDQFGVSVWLYLCGDAAAIVAHDRRADIGSEVCSNAEVRRFRGVLTLLVVTGCVAPAEGLPGSSTQISAVPGDPRGFEFPRPNPLEVYPRRAGARDFDFELSRGEALRFGSKSTIAVASVDRVGPLGDRVAVPSQSADDPPSPARAPGDAIAFSPRGRDDPTAGIRAHVEVVSPLDVRTDASDVDESEIPLWLGACTLTVVADGRVFTSYSEHVSPVGGAATFAVGETEGPFDLTCDLVTLIVSPVGRVVWRVDA